MAGRIALFDLDGTLTDNREGILGCIRHALAALDRACPDAAALGPCLGPPLRESLAWLLDTDDRAHIEAALALYRERYADIGWAENRVYDGIPEALAELSARGERLFVCTSKPAVYARRIVSHFGLDRYFASVHGPDLGGALDDKRTLLAHLLATEHLDPTECTMIGDRDFDIRAGKSNGTRTLGVLWGYGTRKELAAADALAATPLQLAAVLEANRQGAGQSSA